MIIETAHYWAKPGAAETVLELRAALLSVRRALGLGDGALLRKIGEGDGPTLTWVNRYPGVDAMARDIAVRSTSPEFLALCQRMDAALDRFERRIDEEIDVALPDGAVPDGVVPGEIAGSRRGTRHA